MKTLGELIWDENPMEIDNTSPPLDPNGIQIEYRYILPCN